MKFEKFNEKWNAMEFKNVEIFTQKNFEAEYEEM